MKEYDEIMWQAVEDVLEEMYQNSYPKVSWKQRIQDAKDGKDVDKDLISHHYLPKRLYEDIIALAEHNYSYEKFFDDYTKHFSEFLLKGGRACDIDKGGKDDYKDYPSLKEDIGEESFAILEKRIDAYKKTFRFDRQRWKFNFTIMNCSPNSCKERVIEYWKSQGVELNIPDDEKIISRYWGDEED